MDSINKAKEWVKQNAPMFTVLYENKYVGMLYDRFASLAPNRQKQVILGGFAAVGFIVFGILLSLYLSFWSELQKSDRAQAMMDMLLQFQKSRRNQESELQQLDRNKGLSGPDALKIFLVEQGKLAGIPPRFVKAEERADAGEDSAKGTSDMRLKMATAKLERVNLNQFVAFMKNIESGQYSVIISSLQVTNDDKLRGYMNIEVGVAAYLFKGEEEAGL